MEEKSVAIALRYIREHVQEQIQVDEVAVAAMISRRTLENKFRETLGRTVHKEIKRVRANHIGQETTPKQIFRYIANLRKIG